MSAVWFLAKATAAARVLARAARRLRGPRPPAAEVPFVGAYRTRPAVPLAPDPPAALRLAPPPPPRPWSWGGTLGMALTSVAFVLTGVWMACSPRRPADVFSGVFGAYFFGLCAWVFVEQLAAPGPMLTRRAGYRVITAFTVASAAVGHLALTTGAVPLHERLAVGGGAAILMVLGAAALGKMWRRDHPR